MRPGPLAGLLLSLAAPAPASPEAEAPGAGQAPPARGTGLGGHADGRGAPPPAPREGEALPAPPGAPGGPPPPEESAGVPAAPSGFGLLVVVVDRLEALESPPLLRLEAEDGREWTARPRDDGSEGDGLAGDGRWSAPLFGLHEGRYRLELASGEATWKGEVELRDTGSDHPLLELELRPRGTLVARQRDAPSGPQPTTAGAGEAGPAGADEGLLLLGLLALAEAVIALLLAWRGLLLPRAARLGGRPGRRYPPRRLEPAALPALLAGPLRGWRVLLLGELPPGAGRGAELHPVLDPAVLPPELLRAAERLALEPGPPVAVLVTEPDRLEPHRPVDPLKELAGLLGGRAPLWAVEGPAPWARWQPGEASESGEP